MSKSEETKKLTADKFVAQLILITGSKEKAKEVVALLKQINVMNWIFALDLIDKSIDSL